MAFVIQYIVLTYLLGRALQNVSFQRPELTSSSSHEPVAMPTALPQPQTCCVRMLPWLALS